MNAYLVRLQSNKEIVGLFFGPDLEMLIDQIDECTNPYETEFIRLPPGGIYRDDAGAPRVPTAVRYPVEEADIPNWFDRATLSELWADAFYDESIWKPIEPPEDAIILP